MNYPGQHFCKLGVITRQQAYSLCKLGQPLFFALPVKAMHWIVWSNWFPNPSVRVKVV
jgi:hypothetical protein